MIPEKQLHSGRKHDDFSFKGWTHIILVLFAKSGVFEPVKGSDSVAVCVKHQIISSSLEKSITSISR